MAHLVYGSDMNLGKDSCETRLTSVKMIRLKIFDIEVLVDTLILYFEKAFEAFLVNLKVNGWENVEIYFSVLHL